MGSGCSVVTDKGDMLLQHLRFLASKTPALMLQVPQVPAVMALPAPPSCQGSCNSIPQAQKKKPSGLSFLQIALFIPNDLKVLCTYFL